MPATGSYLGVRCIDFWEGCLDSKNDLRIHWRSSGILRIRVMLEKKGGCQSKGCKEVWHPSPSPMQHQEQHVNTPFIVHTMFSFICVICTVEKGEVF